MIATEPPRPKGGVLVLAPNPLGDAVMATPLLRGLAALAPDGRVDVVARFAAARLYEGEPWLGRLYALPNYPGVRGRLRLLRALQHARYAIGVTCVNTFKSALFLRVTGALRRVGYRRECRAFLLTDALPTPGKRCYTGATLAALLAPLGATADPTRLTLTVTERQRAAARTLLAKLPGDADAPLVGLNLGAGFGPSKLWPAASFGALAEACLDRGWRVVLHAAPGEQALVAATLAAVTNQARVGRFVPPLPLAQLKAVVAELDLLVTADTGPRHVAVALGVPVVTLNGPVDPRLGTNPHERGRLLWNELACAPCNRPVCPLGHQACLRELTPARVIEAVEGVLRRADRVAHSSDGLTPRERYVELRVPGSGP